MLLSGFIGVFVGLSVMLLAGLRAWRFDYRTEAFWPWWRARYGKLALVLGVLGGLAGSGAGYLLGLYAAPTNVATQRSIQAADETARAAGASAEGQSQVTSGAKSGEHVGQDAEKAKSFVARGDELLKEGKNREAFLEYRNALEADPLLAAVHLGLGRCHLLEGRYREGRAALEKALELDPDNLQAHLELAGLSLAARELQKALEHAGKAAELDPEGLDGRLLAAEAYRAVGRSGEAQAELEAAASALQARLENASGQERQRLQVALARLYRLQGKIDAAAEVLARTDAESEPAVEVLIERAELLLQQGKVEESIGSYQGLVAAHPGQESSRARLSELLLKVGRTDAAFQVAEKLIKERPDSMPGSLALGQVFLARGLFSAALEQAEAITDSRPGSVQAQKLAIRSLVAQQNSDLARKRIAKLREYFPGDLELQLLEGELLARTGQGEQALEVYAQAVVDHPGSPQPLLAQAQEATRQQQWQQAIEAYERVLLIQPGNPLARNNLALLLAEQGSDPETAYRMASAMGADYPDQPAVLETQGWTAHLSGRSNEALELLEQAVAGLPANPVARHHFGVVLAEAGETERARRELQTALRLAADFPGAEQARSLLDKMEVR